MSGRVSALMVLGMTLVVIGLMYMVFDVMISDYLIAKFWVSTPYMEIMLMQWHAIPTILFLLSLMCFIFAGMSSSGGKQMVIKR